MSFLAPLFLAALAALAGPILLHVRRQNPRERVPFSLVRFLDAGAPPQRRRRRLEHLFLLLLRCLVIALLALAFARPFFGRGAALASASEVHRLVLVDTSASVRGPRFEEVRREAARAIGQAGADDLVAVAAFDRSLRVALPFDRSRSLPAAERRAAALTALRAIEPGWSATDLGGALTAAADLLDQSREHGDTSVVLVVVSDFQRGAATTALAGYQWPARIQVVPAFVGAGAWTNAGVHPPGSRPRPGEPPSVRVTNAAGSERSAFQLDGQKIDVPPGQARSVVPPATAANVATLTGDDFDFDDHAWFTPFAPRAITVDYLGAADANDTAGGLFFLRRALASTPDDTITLRSTPSPDAALAIVDGPLDPAAAAPLRARLAAGASVLLVLGDAASARALEALAGRAAAISEVTPDEPARIGRVNFDDPVFRPFADPKYSDFSHVVTWRYRRLDPKTLPGAAALASFDSGDPLLLRVPVARGTLFVLTTSWRPADSQLALSSKFLPLLHSILDQSLSLAASPDQAWVGDPVSLPVDAAARVVTPAGRTLDAPGHRFLATDAPGLYRTADGRFSFAVNVRPAESEITPLGLADLHALGLPLETVAAPPATEADRRALAREELERRQKSWWWLILAATVVLFIESALAARLPRPRPAPVTP